MNWKVSNTVGERLMLPSKYHILPYNPQKCSSFNSKIQFSIYMMLLIMIFLRAVSYASS
jgi:hypothetical protein